MCLLTDLSLGVSSLSLGHRPTEPRPQGEPATPGPGQAVAVPGPDSRQPAGNQTGYCWAGFNGKAAVVGRQAPSSSRCCRFCRSRAGPGTADPGRLLEPSRLTDDGGQEPGVTLTSDHPPP